MARESTQKKLERVRPPRVQISYDVETGGAIEMKELPFVMGVLGDFSGQPVEPLAKLKERQFVEVTPDNFDDVLASMKPHLQFSVENKLSEDPNAGKLGIDLNFRSMDDFTPEAVARRQRRSFVEGRRTIRGDAFDQFRALEDLDSGTELERRETVIADLDVDEREARISFEGRKLRLPARVAAELEYVLRVDEPFTAADLPGRLDDEGRLVLVRRLVREGLLRIRLD